MPCLFSALVGSLAILQSTLIALAYTGNSERKADQLLKQVRQELEAVMKRGDAR